MKWLKCSEQMPELRQEVIIYDEKTGFLQSGMVFDGTYNSDSHFVDFNEEYYTMKNPSHWMPLPEPPDE